MMMSSLYCIDGDDDVFNILDGDNDVFMMMMMMVMHSIYDE